MSFIRSYQQVISKIKQKIDPFSLQFRLTVGITAVSIFGISSIAIWTSWKMQQLLINSPKQNIQHITKRFPQDVELYSDMMSVETGLKKAIDNRTTPNLLIWVTYPNKAIAAKSITLVAPPWQGNDTSTQLLSLSGMTIEPEIYQINQRYLLICGSPLIVKGAKIGNLYVAQDITSEQTMFEAVIRSMGIAYIVAIVTSTVAIAIYIKRSLQPLRQMSQMTQVISVEDLGQAQLHLEQAPSEVKELANTFNMMLSRLSQAWEQQRQFVSNVSHELRTPLTIVYGYLQSTLRRSTNLTEAQQEALEIAASETDSTIRLLQDLLDLARADSGYMHFYLESLVINDLVAEVVGMAQQFSSREMVIEVSPYPIEIRSDRNRLKQVLLNLIDTALKYSEPNEPVTIKLAQTSDNVTIQVCDKGCGIPLQQQAHIFERFYRVDEARGRSTGGAGLGLSIVKTLIEGMNGSVTVRSKLGEGSVFTVILPAP
jgi:hypothetical protein